MVIPLLLMEPRALLLFDPDEETFRDYLQHKQFYEYREKELLKTPGPPG